MITDARTGEREPAWPTIGVVLAGLAWLGLRAPNLLIAPRFWAEESAFVSAATRLDVGDSLAFIYWRAGYYSWPENLGATLGVRLLPLELAPLATTLLALLLQLSPFLAVLFLRFDFPLSRSNRYVAASVLLTATTSGQGIAWLNTISSQMHLGVLSAVVLVASATQASQSKSWALVSTLLLTGLSGAYSIFLLPVFLLVAIAERDVWRLRQSAALAVAFSIQLGIVMYKRFGLDLINEKRGTLGTSDEAILSGIRESIVLPMFGQRAVMGELSDMNRWMALSLVTLAIASAVLVRSACRTPLRPDRGPFGWLMSIELRCYWAWLATVAAIVFLAFDGIPAGRYAVVPGAITLMIVLLAWHRTRSKLVRILLSGVVAACIVSGLRKPRFPEALECDGLSSGWQASARMASRESLTSLPHCPEGWVIKIYPRG